MVVKGSRVIGLLLGACLFGCGTEAGTGATDGTEALDRELRVGSTGRDVVALHDYLSRFGYFPNAELAARHPRWRPIVDELPGDPATFDEVTARAVVALQENAGLPATGVLDEATRKLVSSSRCGNPDGKKADLSEKFAVHPTTWGTPPRDLTWRVTSGGGGLSRTAVRTAASAALSAWGAATSLTFEERGASESADITITWEALQCGSFCVAGDSEYPPDRSLTLRLNSNAQYSDQVDRDSGVYDVQTVLLHELGHSLGLDHSAVNVTSPNPPVMYGEIHRSTTRRVLQPDDQQAISVAYDTWEQIPNAQALDVSVNWFTNVLNGTVTGYHWFVGADAVTGGFNVYRRLGNTSQLATGNRGAVRIAVDPAGVPWIVDNMGNTFRRTSSSATSGSWTQVPGCAVDIGISSASGGSSLIPNSLKHIWKIDCVASPNGYGGTIKKWDHATSNWIASLSGGNRIAVDGAGMPSVVDIFGGIWRGTTSNPATLGWTNELNCGSDIAVSSSWLWMIGCDGVVYLRNKQTDPAFGSPAPPMVDRWVSVRGTGTNISADSTGRPYVSREDLSLWRVMK